jgi:glycosyltransferase involved in cell wall biosynthesis
LLTLGRLAENHPNLLMIIRDNNIITSPVASVAICTYNQQETISQTIESILNQKCSYPFDLIIAEDGGSDNTRQICIDYQKKYPQQISLLLQESNQGILKNYRDCLALCRGRYIAQCAGDDFWHNPEKLQLQIDFLETHIDYGVLHTDYNLLDSKTGKTVLNKNLADHKKIKEGYIMKDLFYSYNLVAATICFRKELFYKYVPYEDFIRLNFLMEDLPTFVILAKFCKVGYLPVSTATYRKSHSSLTNQTNALVAERFYNSMEIVNRYLCEKFPEDIQFEERHQRVHKNLGILTASYKSFNFLYAKKYGRELMGDSMNSKMITFSQNPLMFYTFCLLKALKVNG